MTPWLRDLILLLGAACLVTAAALVQVIMGLGLAGVLLLAVALLYDGGNGDGTRNS